METILHSIIFGIIQGLTEFLPVSSSGHLVILQNLFEIPREQIRSWDVLLHLGTLVIILNYFKKDWKRLILSFKGILIDLFTNISYGIRNIFTPADIAYKRIVTNNYRKIVLMLIISSLCTGCIGYVFGNITEDLYNSYLLVGTGFYITGVIFFVLFHTGEGTKLPREVGYVHAIILGCLQGLSVFPGVSSFGILLAAGIMMGFGRSFAIKYALFASVPAVIGAVILDIGSLFNAGIAGVEIVYGVIGIIIAGFIGFVSIRISLGIVKKGKFQFFAIYGFVIGTAAIACNYLI